MSLAVRKTHRVERVNTEAELFALKEPWTALLTDSPEVSTFLTWSRSAPGGVIMVRIRCFGR
jgi:hypothetical protein